MINISRYTCARTRKGEAGTPLMAAYADGHRQGQDVPRESLAHAHTHVFGSTDNSCFDFRKASVLRQKRNLTFIQKKVN